MFQVSSFKFQVYLTLIISVLFISCDNNKVGEKEFATKEPIDKIFMANSNGGQVSLTKEDNKWIVNGQHTARKEMVDILLKTIQKVKANYPVSKKEQLKIETEIASSHTKVELYQDGKLLKTYFVGGHTHDMMGTYFYMEGASKPYVCFIPGFEGYLTPRFFTNEEEWRSRVIFNHKRESIKKVDIQYNPEIKYLESFTIESNKDNILIKNGDEASVDISDMEIGKQYLSFFENIQIEGFETNITKKDSVIRTKPVCQITIETKDGKKKSANVYYMNLNQRSKTQFDRKGNKLKHDLDRMYISFNEAKDFGIIQMFVFGKIFQNYSAFIQKDNIQNFVESRKKEDIEPMLERYQNLLVMLLETEEQIVRSNNDTRILELRDKGILYQKKAHDLWVEIQDPFYELEDKKIKETGQYNAQFFGNKSAFSNTATNTLSSKLYQKTLKGYVNGIREGLMKKLKTN